LSDETYHHQHLKIYEQAVGRRKRAKKEAKGGGKLENQLQQGLRSRGEFSAWFLSTSIKSMPVHNHAGQERNKHQEGKSSQAL
jgi:hypothetical protein